MAHNRTQFRGLSRASMGAQIRVGGIGSCSTLRQSSMLCERFQNMKISKCLTATNKIAYRMTDQGLYHLMRHYTYVRMLEFNDRDSGHIRIATMAVVSAGWLQALPTDQDPTDEEYAEIFNKLRSLPIPASLYNATLSQWSRRYARLIGSAGVGERQPHRCHYHLLQLHYLVPELVGPESRDILRRYCDFEQEADMVVVDPAFDPDRLEEEALRQSWSQLTNSQLIRTFELMAVVDLPNTEKKLNSSYVAMVMAMAKAGGGTADWVDKRLDHLAKIGNIALDMDLINQESLLSLHTHFIRQHKLTSYDIYQYLLGIYQRGSANSIDPLNWIIEQTSLVHTGSLSAISQVCIMKDIRYEMLVHIGIAPEQFTACAELACHLLYNKLSAIVEPPVTAARYGTLFQVCTALFRNTTLDKFQGKAGSGGGYARLVGAQMAEQLELQWKNNIQAKLHPLTILSARYNVRCVQRGELYYVQADQVEAQPENPDEVAPEQPANDQVDERGRTIAEIWASTPMSAKDRAWNVICQAIMLQGTQSKWAIVNLNEEVPSPNRPVAENVVAAARELGYEWNPGPDDFVPNAVVNFRYVRPPWDLNCYNLPPIRGRDTHPRGGHQGGPPDDDDNNNDDNWPDNQDPSEFRERTWYIFQNNRPEQEEEEPEPTPRRRPNLGSNRSGRRGGNDDGGNDGDGDQPGGGGGGVIANLPGIEPLPGEYSVIIT
uniref:Putative nucleoprotein n=1 Tax=Atrato Chu-like virus 4 TaxID=2689324 RepID=A0A6B9KPC8_9VIRU|nr:putative nucleoprotein [Atrato Chu-like virus 4]